MVNIQIKYPTISNSLKVLKKGELMKIYTISPVIQFYSSTSPVRFKYGCYRTTTREDMYFRVSNVSVNACLFICFYKDEAN